MQPLDPLTLPLSGVRLIEASAGTGKTYTIATLYLRLLLERNLSVRRILVVTFTKAATEELRDRIRARLHAAHAALTGAPAEDPLLEAVIATVGDRAQAAARLMNELTCLDEAAVFTIHGFCQRMLQENAFESGALFDTEFVTDESELLGQVVRDFWRRNFYGSGLARLARERWGEPVTLLKEIRPYLGKPDLVVRPQWDAVNGDDPDSAFRAQATALRALWQAQRDAIVALITDHDGLSRAKDAYKPELFEAACAALDDWCAAPAEEFTFPAGFELFTATRLAESITEAKRKKGVEPPTHPFFTHAESLLALRAAKQVALTAEAIDWCRAELARRKQERGVMAFDDLLVNLRAALDAPGGAQLAARIAENYPAALIDEFQDTDLSQFRIFSGVYHARPECGLFLIGDPKQAIYSFRGADIFTYMQAKEATPGSARYTLGVNWRSGKKLVEAVNTLFETAHVPFLYGGAIDFQAVEAAGRADEKPLLVDGAQPAPLTVWLATREENQRQIQKGAGRAQLAQACAAEVARLLTLGAGGRAVIGSEPLAPRDVAVLVRDRNEAGAVQEALREAGVRSVYLSRESVFAGEEARALERLLTAVLEPGDEGVLRAALCDSLIGLTAAELDALLRDEIAWEERVQRFHFALGEWREHGFMAMFRRLLHEERIPARLLSVRDGERRLSDLLQLAELMQTAAADHSGPEQLLRWFAEQRREPDGEREEEQLRLESDEALVKIVTIHRSKGLEYPVVFLPFLWSARGKEKGAVLYHEEATPDATVLHLTPAEEHRALAERERLAEEVRLAYVALTRARHLCYFAWGAFKDAERSALAWLLYADPQTQAVDALAAKVAALDDAQHAARLAELALRCGGALAVTEPPAAGCRLAASTVNAEQLACRAPQRSVLWNWRISSFSGLTAGRYESGERPDYGSRREDAEGEAEASRNRFRFPKGARAGVFLHALLQRLDFPAARGAALSAETERQLRRHGFDTQWRAPVEAWLGEVLETPLAEGGPTLRAIARSRRLDELEFHYPIAPLAPKAIERLLAKLGRGADETLALRTPRLEFQPAAGVMRGFIDLIFEHEGRWYLADYKSSWLGARFDAYLPARLADAVAAHRYDLQYLIYTLALHRHLRARLPDYDYARHFGGVYYLFLRGMEPQRGAACGVWFDRPEQAVIEAFDAQAWGTQP